MNYLREFGVYIDIILILKVFNAKILFFFKGRCEKIIKCGDAQGGITNK